MWLLDAKSIKLVFFANEEQTPPYAILSHTWSDEEVSFQDIMSNTNNVAATKTGWSKIENACRLALPFQDTKSNTSNVLATKTGWSKIENACRLALSFGLEYVWIDTCCIDKSSSAELQEAINSMFRWYELAQKCLAHLSDVSASEYHDGDSSSFCFSRWFMRGWTLQELIAPPEVYFYDKEWKLLSTRKSLAGTINRMTGIREFFLDSSLRCSCNGGICNMLSLASVAERMSWMDERETTRPEDLAYCLLGIFDINMPMLYGEGPKAFQRLQEEIMKRSDDSTLFSWGYQEPYNTWSSENGSLLAPHPWSFRNCYKIGRCPLQGFNSASFSMTQRGLKMEVPVRKDPTYEPLIYMLLGCSLRSKIRASDGKSSAESFIAIPLISTSAYSRFQHGQGPRKGEYIRPTWCRPTLVSEEFLSQAESVSIVIRRSSEGLGEFEKLPVSIPSHLFLMTESYDILGIYPPQPIEDQFVDLQANVSHNLSDTTGDMRPPMDPHRKIHPSTIYSQGDKMMLHIRIPIIGTFIVVLGYRTVVYPSAIHKEKWRYLDFDCRTFKSPRNFVPATLDRLSIIDDFPRMEEVDSRFEEDRYIFNIGDEADAHLEVQFLHLKDSVITDIHIRVKIRSLDKRHDEDEDKREERAQYLYDEKQHLRRITEFVRKVSR